MAGRGGLVRIALYLAAGGFLLYMAWPLLKGQGPRGSEPRTRATPVRVSRRRQQMSRPATTTRVTGDDLGPPLDGPVQDVVVMAGWKQTNCGASSDPLKITVTHMEFEQEGHLIVSFDIELDQEIASPLQVNMSQWTMVGDDEWQVVPCGDIRGSCLIEDLCATFTRLKCPSLRGLLKPSLQCPIQPGSYSVPVHHYPTVVEDFVQPVATRYHFTSSGQHLACYDLLTVAEKL